MQYSVCQVVLVYTYILHISIYIERYTVYSLVGYGTPQLGYIMVSEEN